MAVLANLQAIDLDGSSALSCSSVGSCRQCSQTLCSSPALVFSAMQHAARGPASRWLAVQACRQQVRGLSKAQLDAKPAAAGCSHAPDGGQAAVMAGSTARLLQCRSLSKDPFLQVECQAALVTLSAGSRTHQLVTSEVLQCFNLLWNSACRLLPVSPLSNPTSMRCSAAATASTLACGSSPVKVLCRVAHAVDAVVASEVGGHRGLQGCMVLPRDVRAAAHDASNQANPSLAVHLHARDT